jgi:hypothetical protein
MPGWFWQKHPLIRQHRHLPLTKSTKTELQRIDTPVPLPAPACRCHLEHTDDRQTAIETCKGSSRGISWLGISSYKPSRVISWLGLKELAGWIWRENGSYFWQSLCNMNSSVCLTLLLPDWYTKKGTFVNVVFKPYIKMELSRRPFW